MKIKAQLKWLYILGLAGAQDVKSWTEFFRTRNYQPKVNELVTEFQRMDYFKHDELSKKWLGV